MHRLKRLFIIAVLLIAGIFLVNAAFLGMRVYQGVKLAATSQAFEIRKDQPQGRILVVGDDTGVGTGAHDPRHSVAGRIARDFPSVEVINRSSNGASLPEVFEQLRSSDEGGFDVILIQAGSIDILRLKNPDEMKDHLSRLFHLALSRASAVIVMGVGNIGIAPALFPPVSWMYTERARNARELFVLLARQTGVEYVDLFREQDREPFGRDPKRYFALDLLHPGDEGYGLWYRELLRQSSLAERIGVR